MATAQLPPTDEHIDPDAEAWRRLFSDDLRDRVAAVLRHVRVTDGREPVYRDDRKWLAMLLLALTSREEPGKLVYEDELGNVTVSVTASVAEPWCAISQLERNEMTAAALMGRWPW